MKSHHFKIDDDEFVVTVEGDWSGDADIRHRKSTPYGERWRPVATLPGKLLRACSRHAAFDDVIATIKELEPEFFK